MPHRLPLAALAVAGTLLLAACGSDDSSDNSGTSAPTTASSASSASSAAVVQTAGGSLGTHLVDGSGRTLYLWVADTSSQSTCDGACAEAWPPLSTTGAPKAGAGVRASLLGTTARSDGTREVTYAGHPLYFFAGDTSPGQTTGQGSDEFGAPWWAVAPSGKAIENG
jgi:predicted lipoprotein with Yx(FWY)xxD motif